MRIKNINGYTLIEILIALTVITILFTVGFVSYRDFSRRQALQGAVKVVQGDLRKTQQNAMSGIKPAGASCNNPNSLIGYNFTVLAGGSGYTIEASCSGGSIVMDTVSIPTGITINPLPSPNPILFKVLGQGTNIPGTGTTITLSQTGTGSTLDITIGAGGDIK